MAFIHDHRSDAHRDDNTLYLTNNNHVFTRTGHMDDEHDMPEEYVKAFVQHCKPSLFAQLHGLPISSRDVPMSFHGQRSLRRSSQIDEENRKYASCLDHPISAEESVVLETDAITPDRPCQMESTLPTLDLRAASFSGERNSRSPPHQRRRLNPGLYPCWAVRKAADTINYKLQSGFCMYSRVLHDADYPLSCSFPFCRNVSSIPCGTQYISLEYDHQTNSITNNHTVPWSVQQFCGDCFNTIYPTGSHMHQLDVINSSEPSPDRDSTEPETHLLMLDGVSRETVLEAAARLYPTLPATYYKSKILGDSRNKADFACKYPASSPQKSAERAAKSLEIDATLTEVAKYEKAIALFRRQQEQNSLVLSQRGESPDASVLITRPAYMEPARERYKKQGLTKHDRAKYRMKVKLEEQEIDPGLPALNQSLRPGERYCYCRDVELPSTELVRCASDWCPVGWFHLSCTGLDHLPTTENPFYCYYCVDDLGPFVSKRMINLDEQSILEEADEQGHIYPEGFHRRLQNEYNPETIYHPEVVDDSDDESGEYINSDYDFSWSPADAVLHNTIHRWGIAVNDSQAMRQFSGTKTTGPETDIVSEIEADRSSLPMSSAIYSPMTSSLIEADDISTGIESNSDGSDYTNGSESTIVADLTPTIKDVSDFGLPCPYEFAQTPVNSPTNTTSRYSRSTLSPSVNLPSDNETCIATTPIRADIPSTPILAPIRISTKPWGTPVNIDRLILEPTSPTPVKRKHDETSDDKVRQGTRALPESVKSCKGLFDVDETSDSQDDGEEFPTDGEREGESGVENMYEDDGEDENETDEGEEVPIMLDVESLRSS